MEFVRHVTRVHPNTKLTARVHRAAGTARRGRWTWAVRMATSGKLVARCKKPYVRRFAAERGVARAFPAAVMVEA